MNLELFRQKSIELMTYHKLYNWRFAFDRSLARVGCCNYRTKTLSFSIHYVSVNKWEDIKDVVLHEIAHSLTPGHNHDYIWKKMAVSIGAKPERCTDLKAELEKKWILDCNCQKKQGFFRKPKRVDSKFKCCACNYVGYLRKNNELSISE